MIKTKLLKGQYFDSVTLMNVSKEISESVDVEQIALMMATPANCEILKSADMLKLDKAEISPDSLIITVKAGTLDCAEQAIITAEAKLKETKKTKPTEAKFSPKTIKSAVKNFLQANMTIISVPGEFASYEAQVALEEGLHVLLFSDNVPLDEEVKLKKLAHQKGLLMMGPDCGTAIINGAALAFANVVPKGSIGIVGASGTGIQALSVLVAKEGAGIWQAIGTGSRDLSPAVDGIMVQDGIKALTTDINTKVIILVSKPPNLQVASKIVSALNECKLPVIVNFLGADAPQVSFGKNVIFTRTLFEAALYACALAKKERLETVHLRLEKEERLITDIAKDQATKITPGEKYVRGLYSGGSLASESIYILKKSQDEVYSNIKGGTLLKPPYKSKRNTIIDLGEDYFTKGRPHPMIDCTLRCERILQEVKDSETAVVLLDVVLGYGSHPDPASELVPAIKKAQEYLKEQGRYVSFIASVCGTEADPQILSVQEEKLKEIGVIVLPNDTIAATLASKVAEICKSSVIA